MKLKSVLSLTVLAASCVSAMAVEPLKEGWPQWGGVNRDHKSQETGLLQSWPAGGPKLLATFKDVGMGYSSLAVSEGKLYSLGMADGKNFAFCLDVGTGKEIWRQETGASTGEYNTGWGGGPRSTPTVLTDRVVVLDDAGNCCTLDKSSGKLLWQTNLIKDHGGKMPKWGFSESPLVDGDRVVVCPGGPGFLIALDLNTGKKVLSSTGYDADPHYVSVIKHNVDGVDCYTTACGKGLVSFAVDDGRTLWINGSTGAGTATIPTPIIQGNYVYHTAGYGVGCVLMKLTSPDKKSVTAEQVYANKNQINHHGGVILVDDKIFGMKSRAGWVVHGLMDGEVKWEGRVDKEAGASVAYADGRIYVYGEKSGNCYLLDPKSDAWSVKGELTIPAKSSLNRGQGQVWSHPVVAEGKLFLRDLDLIYVYDVKK